MPTAAYTLVKSYIEDDTNRPDLCDDVNSGVAKRRIQRAVYRYHTKDFWQRDFIEQIYAFQEEQALQVMNLDLLPRLRSFGYIRKWDSTAQSSIASTLSGAAGAYFGEKNPSMMLDGYGYNTTNSMYRSGSTVKLLSSTAFQAALIGWFQFPDIADIENSDSWILADYSNLIAADVSMRIFADIGKDEEAARKRDELALEILSLQTNNIKLAVLSQ